MQALLAHRQGSVPTECLADLGCHHPVLALPQRRMQRRMQRLQGLCCTRCRRRCRGLRICLRPAYHPEELVPMPRRPEMAVAVVVEGQ